MAAWSDKQDAIGALVARRKSWVGFQAEAQEAGFAEIAARLTDQISRIDVHLTEREIGCRPILNGETIRLDGAIRMAPK